MDIFIFILVFGLGFWVISRFNKHLDTVETRHLQLIWPYHVSVGVYYCLFIPGDAREYWFRASNLDVETFWRYLFETRGTDFVTAINFLPASILELSYFSGTLLYTLIGFLGIVLFYVTIIRLVPYNTPFAGQLLFPLLLLLPNLHFWSVAIGKDTLVFFSIAWLVYSFVTQHYVSVFLSLLLCYLVRPHIAIMLVASFGSVIFLSRELSFWRKLIISGLFLAGAINVLPFVLDYVKASELSIETFSAVAENKVALLSRAHTGSKVDITSYPLPLKLFTFLYRPFFFDINGIPAVIASLENLLLFLLTIKLIRSKPVKAFIAAPVVIKSLVLFLIIGTVLFSHSLGNVGIMIRMRNMFLPGMLIFMLWTFSYHQLYEYRSVRNLSYGQ